MSATKYGLTRNHLDTLLDEMNMHEKTGRATDNADARLFYFA
jgi:hypothetical protein